MVYAYIGAALIVGLLIGVITLAIFVMAKRVTFDINKKTRQLISAYDEILNKKSEELSRLSEEMTAREAAAQRSGEEQEDRYEEKPVIVDDTAVVKVADIMNSTTYVDSGVGEIYRTIREGVDMTPLDALRLHAPYVFEPGSRKKEGSTAEELLKKLDFDMVYEMSLIPGDTQYALLSESLLPAERALLDDYVKERNSFSIIDFCDELKARSYEEKKIPTLYVPERDLEKRYPSGVNVVLDNDICEGFCLEADNKLYDYSVRGREIS